MFGHAYHQFNGNCVLLKDFGLVGIYYGSLCKQQTEPEEKTNHEGLRTVLQLLLVGNGIIDYLCWAPVRKEAFNTLIHSIDSDKYSLPSLDSLLMGGKINQYI